MPSQRYKPAAPLAAFVECLWYWESAPTTHSKERLLPNGESAIIFNLRDEPIRIYDAQDFTCSESFGHAVISGARSNSFVIDTEQEERVIGIAFRPGGAYPFLQAPVSELEDRSIALADLWPTRAGSIRERVLESSTPDAMLRTLERCLLKQLVRAPELHPAVDYALNRFQSAGQTSRIDEVNRQIGLSPRRFIELFHRQVGLTPKVFCRVRRFQRVLHSIHGRREIDWVRIALDCGYYDQAHFIHDFRSFSGLTPNAYIARATEHLNHVPVI